MCNQATVRVKLRKTGSGEAVPTLTNASQEQLMMKVSKLRRGFPILTNTSQDQLIMKVIKLRGGFPSLTNASQEQLIMDVSKLREGCCLTGTAYHECK